MADEEHLRILQHGLEVWNDWQSTNVYDDLRADLSNIDLSNANFEAANFANADLSGVNFGGANLIRANFTDTDLSGANLQNADLSGVDFTDTDLSGVNFSGATLYRANFTDTNLIGIDFRDAELVGSNLSNTNLNGAYLSGVNLSDANLSDANLRGANLNRAYLINANLSNANLNRSDLSGANLRNANLSNANLNRSDLSGARLTIVQALETNFEGATLTGACIEDWNINGQTNLNNVKCDYIYLNSTGYYSLEKNYWIFSDRRPHDPDQIFAPGEFTKLFQKALETVDLIFSEGIEWTAFLESFQQLQAEVKSEELSIQGIEKKSGGAFIVRLEVPQEANKAEIEKYIKQEYEAKLKVIEASYQKQLRAKDETIQAYREQGTDLLKMVEIMSSFQQNTIINNSPNMSNQSGNFGIGQNNGNISGHSKVVGQINEAAPPNLAQDNIDEL